MGTEWDNRGAEMAGRLTAAIVRSLSQPGMYGDGATLYLRVAPGGSKSWVQRLAIKGKRHDLGLGGYPLVTLVEARQFAFENRRMVQRGGDPLAEKRRAKVPTFWEAVEATIQAHRKRATLRWAQAHGFVEHNAAGEGIDGALPRMPSVQSHFRALPYKEVPAALAAVEASNASLSAKLSFRFTVLTAARSGEARLAVWSEMNLEERLWRIPGKRMKNAAEHRVPLSDAVLEVLAQAARLRDGSDLVFPSPLKPRRPMSNMTLTKLLRDTGLAKRATVHGFRSSFRDWCGETGKPRELAEAALAHAVKGVEGAYFRSDLLDRRRRLMQQWGQFLAGESATVVRLRG